MSMMTIGDAARRSGVSAKTIRYYESIGLIRPASRHGNNYRAYRDQDVEFLRFIQRARRLGFSLKEVDALIALYRNRRRTSREVKRLALGHIEELNRKIAELVAIRNALQELAQKCRGDDRPECPILDELGCGASSKFNSDKAANK
jgi:MerR family transcriptional regulator, copper efflux regulator